MPFPPAGNGPYRLLRAFCGGPLRAFEATLADPVSAQRARLRTIAQGAAGTAFGRDHGLTGEESLETWRRLPVRTHAELLPWLDRVEQGEGGVLTRSPPRMLLETSGTTSRPKHLPVTGPWADSVASAQRLWVLGLVRDDEALAQGSAFSIVSPAETSRSAGGLPIGSNTGRMFLAQPWWVRWRAPVPYDAYCIADPELRAYTILRHALAQPVRSWTTANPSTILLYCRRMREWWEDLRRDCADGTLRGKRGFQRRVLPELPAIPWDLRRVSCWKGGAASFFVELLPGALGRDVPVREAGISASEGYFAIPVDDGDPVAWLGGHLLEFLDDAGEARWAWEVEEGREYRLLISTEAGLYRYDLGDVVRITGWEGRVPRMVFVRRHGNVLNAVGEKVTEEQIAEVARAVGARAISASVGMAEVPWLRFASDAAGDVDAALRRINVEYEQKRATGRLGPAEVRVVPAESFAVWRAERIAAGAPEAQVKDPWILSPEAWERLVSC